MSEKLLKAILQLFAVVAKEDGVHHAERANIKEFLSENLNESDVDHYMELLDLFASETQEGLDVLPQIDPNINDETIDFIDDWSKVIQNSEFINKELTKQQKLVLVLKMIELIYSDGDMSERESNLVFYIGQTIKIDRTDVNRIKNFVISTKIQQFNSSQFLIVSEDDADLSEKAFFLRSLNMEGFLSFLRIPSEETYFVKYVGESAVYLNGILLKNGRSGVFSTGSTIRSSLIEPIFYSDIVSHFLKAETDNKISFEAKNISYKFKTGHIGLRDVQLHEESGNLVGLMGSSGSGKSTLLNVLNGNEKPKSGEVLINGINIHTEPDKIKGVIGYVPQDDLLIEDLSVFQNLYYAAQLCFKKKSELEIRQLVEKTLKSLGLSEIKELKVGTPLQKTISGGQRKRLNIGLELLREPSVLFLDEPTSGLSSRDSENILDLLKELSLKGKLIFVVIHQPSSDIFKMFDRLIILDVGGYQIFYGNPVEAEVYFKDIINMIDRDSGSCPTCGNIRPEEVFNIIETKVVNEYGRFTDQRKVTPEQWNEHFKYRTIFPSVETETKPPPSSLNLPGRLKQLKIFTIRDILSKLSNTQYIVISLFEAPLLAFILAYIVRYYHVDGGEGEYVFSENVNIPAYFFMSIIVALFMGLTVSAEEIIKDRKILKRESFLNLSKGSYVASKIIILFTFSAIQTFMFVLIGDYILEIDGMSLEYWLVLFSTSCFANILGLNISATFNSVITVYILIPLLLIPQLILSGVVVQFDKLNPQISNASRVPLIGELMASRWAYEAVMVTQFKENDFEKVFYPFDKTIKEAEYKNLYLIPTLKTYLSNSIRNINSSNQDILKSVQNDLSTLRNSIAEELNLIGKNKFDKLDHLTVSEFDSSTYKKTQAFLKSLEKFYANRLKKHLEAKDELIKEVTSTPEGQEKFQKLRGDFQNERIQLLVTNKTEEKRVVRNRNALIQKVNPIYNEPDPHHSLDFRTHFFAPSKHFAGFHIETLQFNVIIIWLMTLILVYTLYFDLFRFLLVSIGNLWRRYIVK
ncbi:MAG: ATP-binding cassette domain-containing protein [Bacteroidota bacterium]